MQVGDIVRFRGADARILAITEGYALLRRAGCIPFVERVVDLRDSFAPSGLPPATEGMNTYDAAQFIGMKEQSLIVHARAGRVGFRAQKGRRIVYRFYKDDLLRFREARP